MIYSEEYKIGQSSAKDLSVKDYYEWAIWIEPNPRQLSEIEYVEYLLHPTFKNRLRKVEDLKSGFRLESKGWGEFLIEISIFKKNGERLQLTHWLELKDNYTTIEEEIKNPDFKGKKVYISYSKIDSRKAKTLASLLVDLGMKVSSGSHYQAGVPIEDYIENSIDTADLVININSERPTAWHQSELDFAQKKSKEIISMDNIIDAGMEKSSFKSRHIADSSYGKNLKTLENHFKSIKF